MQNGETMNRDCDEKCTCNRGEWICEPRCSGNTFKRGSQTFENNTNCYEKVSEEDECCATMACNDKVEENGEFLTFIHINFNTATL